MRGNNTIFTFSNATTENGRKTCLGISTTLLKGENQFAKVLKKLASYLLNYSPYKIILGLLEFSSN